MRVALRLEEVNEFFRCGRTKVHITKIRPRPWVAKIKYCCKTDRIIREFIRPTMNYSRANTTGSRGIYRYYWLNTGVYEIYDIHSWKFADRYFCAVENGQLIRVDFEWVKNYAKA
jgi:hypothetical protein